MDLQLGTRYLSAVTQGSLVSLHHFVDDVVIAYQVLNCVKYAHLNMIWLTSRPHLLPFYTFAVLMWVIYLNIKMPISPKGDMFSSLNCTKLPLFQDTLKGEGVFYYRTVCC